MSTRIYIAGPYCPRNVPFHDAARIANQNVRRAIEKFHELKSKGHEPFVPHLSHFIHIEGDYDYGDWWTDYDMTFLEHWAEAIYMLKGWKQSPGANREYERAIHLGLKIIMEK